MKVLSKVIDFLFGKEPQIFDSRGNVIHQLPKKKWDEWQDRFRKDENYNFRKHSATESAQTNKN